MWQKCYSHFNLSNLITTANGYFYRVFLSQILIIWIIAFHMLVIFLAPGKGSNLFMCGECQFQNYSLGGFQVCLEPGFVSQESNETHINLSKQRNTSRHNPCQYLIIFFFWTHMKDLIFLSLTKASLPLLEFPAFCELLHGPTSGVLCHINRKIKWVYKQEGASIMLILPSFQ